MPSSHNPSTDRSKGGPGSSHETTDSPGAKHAGAHHQHKDAPNTPGEAKSHAPEGDKADHGHAGSRGRQ